MAPQRRRSRSATDQDSAEQDPGEQRAEQDPGEQRAEQEHAERKPDERAPAEADADGHPGGHAGGGRRDGAVRTAREAAKAALRQVMELTSKPPESITGVQRTQEGWSVSFEAVEDRRIPSSADILATYEAKIDPDGELTSFRRIKRYIRGRQDSNGGSAK
jgi:hypothetical protein